MRLNTQRVAFLERTFSEMLDQDLGEQMYQEYIEQNTPLVPREFIQNHGVHFQLVFRKLSLARDYSTDFFFLSKSSRTWHCVLIEIEKPSSTYFRNGSNDFHPDFQHALMQVNRWRAWFANRANFDGFINGTLAPIRVPMQRNPCYIKYVLVHGRRAEFAGNELRTSLVHAQERDDFSILSFDSLLEDIGSKSVLYLAVRRNEFIDLVSSDFVDETVFSRVSPHSIRISRALRRNILGNRDAWFHYKRKDKLVLDEVLPLIVDYD